MSVLGWCLISGAVGFLGGVTIWFVLRVAPLDVPPPVQGWTSVEVKIMDGKVEIEEGEAGRARALALVARAREQLERTEEQLREPESGSWVREEKSE